MKPVTDLYGRHEGADIYVVGSGTSMRVFPVSFLEGKVTIGLNMAWKSAPVQYSITIGPHLNVPEFMDGEAPHPEITWITKEHKARLVLTPEQFEHADARFYAFTVAPKTRPAGPDLGVNESARVLDYVRRPTGTMLYQWASISQTAANLAANLGARNVILVGCDNCSLSGNHHGHQQHTKWLGKEPDERYRQYYEGLVEVRTALRERGVNLLSLSPFLKLDEPDLDFTHLCDELDRPALVAPSGDVSESDHPHRFAAASGAAARPPTPPSLLRSARRFGGKVARRALPNRGGDLRPGGG